MSSKVILFILLLYSSEAYSQSTLDSVLNNVEPDKLSSPIEKRFKKLERKVVFKSEKILRRLSGQEVKIFERQLATKDSFDARLKLAEIVGRYKAFAEKLRNPSSLIASNLSQYVPHLDTVYSTLKFLDQNKATANVKAALSKVESFNGRLQQLQEIKNFIRERQETIQQGMERLHLTKKLKPFNKQVYYYSEQIKEYKEMISHPSKIEKEIIGFLSKTKAFQDFIRKNSVLASLFRIPGNPDDPGSLVSLAGLQTRVEVNNLMRQRLTPDRPIAQLQFQQNIQEAQSELSLLKGKLTKAFPGVRGSIDDGDVIPEKFRPNSQKTRSFLKRMEYGINVQAQKATNFFPATTDLGLSVGYKLNDRSIIGVGASYKAGLGRGWNHMELSSQGAGLRSYVDWRLKGTVWLSGGLEMNYKSQLNGVQFNLPFGRGRQAIAWQKSGLIGLSKLIDVKSKFFKKTKLQLLWDFLSYQQLPQTHPLVFRIGYNLK